MAASLFFSAVVKSLEESSLPLTLSTFPASPIVTSVVFALLANEVVTSAVLALPASAVVVANPLKSWSPVFVPVMAASLVFSSLL
jgi:hypothetical protein